MKIISEFRSLLGEVASFVREDFTLAKYSYAVGLIVLFDVLEIRSGLFSGFISSGLGTDREWLAAPLLYLALYFLMLVPTVVMSGESWRLRRWQAWVLPAALLCLQGMSQFASYYYSWLRSLNLGPLELYFTGSSCVYLVRGLTILLGICLFRFATERRFGLFGLPRNGRYLELYAMAFLVMLPFLVIFSSTDNFLNYYPVFKFWEASGAFGFADWQLSSLFDLSYSIDYFSVECIFRGAFVIGLMRWLGLRSILPMILVYTAIHAGKPYVEMCSAAVGGYLLGVLAFRTKHLWGGIFAHVAIAISMEVLASMWHLL